MSAPPPLSADPKHRLARLYSTVAPDYEEKGPPIFVHAGKRLIEIAGVAPGHTVLDIATGRGAVLFPAAERVGSQGLVIGIDLAEGMVVQTRAAIARRALAHASVQQMDAECLNFPDTSFDRVLCSFAVFFFPDVTRVLVEIRRVLRPSGTIGFAFTRSTDPQWRWYEELLAAYGALDGLPPSLGMPGIRNAGALTALLTEAGFANARETVEDAELLFEDEDAWWASLWTHGSRVPLERLAPDVLERLRAECLARARALRGPKGLVQRHTFVYIIGEVG